MSNNDAQAQTKTGEKPWIDKAQGAFGHGPSRSGAKSATGISNIRRKVCIRFIPNIWRGYQMLATLWLIYGITHKERLITLYQTAWIVVQTFIILGIIMYGDMGTLWSFGF